MSGYGMAIDQGTTGTTVVILDETLKVLSKCNTEFEQIYPQPGWVEHNPQAIWDSVCLTVTKALEAAQVSGNSIASIGITNQRETTVVWERNTSQAIHNAIVWQCRRTADICEGLKEQALEAKFKERTGLVLDAYFSGTKVAWILDNVAGARTRAQNGELAFGTIDSYLVWQLSGGQAHVTDVSNASRTLLFNLHSMNWDAELCEILRVPAAVLPEVRSCSEHYGVTRNMPGLPDGIPISGMAGDQQAALFGQACFERGQAKCTYGTGAFLLVNTGETPVASEHGMLTTVAWQLGDKVTYALEGSAFIAGAAVQWLRDGMGLISDAAEIEGLAASVNDCGGVIFVPALTGLGAPHWRPEARGAFLGITRGTTQAHLARAVLEGIALQITDILNAMADDLGSPLAGLRVDGGACKNNLLMQFQADILSTTIKRPTMIETTALGAAFLGGLSAGVWSSTQEITDAWLEDREFVPQMTPQAVQSHLERWSDAVSRS
ncbi:MAG TPA: glycerol kinase GlpK [Myxococcales bacterium]|nr:glycerol kinase GlpK [Myxococcales bacterium]